MPVLICELDCPGHGNGFEPNGESFRNYFGVPVGEMYEGKMDIANQITVASIQTLYAILKRNNEETKQLKMYLYNVACCLADESQNVKNAGMYESVANYMYNVDYLIGLSGTPFREDNQTLEMNSLVGFIIYSKTTQELEADGWLVPTKTYFLSIEQNEDQVDGIDYHQNYESFITKNNPRNEVVRDFTMKYREQKKILILVKSIDHGKALMELIEGSFFLNGKTAKKKRKTKCDEFKNTRDLVLISMTSICATGIDVPSLDIVFNASANGSDITTLQAIGRPKRLFEGKEFGYYIDFSDESEYFQPMANKRVNALERFGNEVIKIHHTEWSEKIQIE